MAQNSDNIAITRPKTDGAAWVAGSDAATPTNVTSALTGFESLGWISEDGIRMTINKTTEDLKGYGGDVALTIQTEHSVEFKVKPLELSAVVLREMLGQGNVTADEATGRPATAKVTSDELDVRKYVFDLRGRNGQLIRVVVPKAKLTELGEIPFKTGEPVASEFTIAALPDTAGVKVYLYFGVEAAGE